MGNNARVVVLGVQNLLNFALIVVSVVYICTSTKFSTVDLSRSTAVDLIEYLGNCILSCQVCVFIPNTEALVLHYSEEEGAGAGCGGGAFLCTTNRGKLL